MGQHSAVTGRVTVAPCADGHHWAYLPHVLPPYPQKTSLTDFSALTYRTAVSPENAPDPMVLEATTD